MNWCRSRIVCGMLVLAASVGACADRSSDEGSADAPQQGGTVVVALLSDLENLNSLVAGERYTQEVNRYMLFLPLVRYTDELGFEPALAERWEMEGDSAVVMHLRQDVTWHDGQPTTARDVVFTFSRAQDPATGYPNAEYFTGWKQVQTAGQHAVRIVFEPQAEPLAGLPFLPIMPAHLLDSIPADRMRQAAFNRAPVGNGPFRFQEYRANDRWVFVANEQFPESLGGRPWIDRIVLRPIPDATAQVTELETGNVDMILAARPEDFGRLSQAPGLRGIQRPGRQFANVMWNGRRPGLDDADVRRALTMALDREQIIQVIRAGYGTPASGPIGSYHWAYDASIQPLPLDREGAGALLDEKGIRDRDGDGVRELPNGEPFRIELKLPNTQVNRDLAELVRQDLATVGVAVTTVPLDFATLIQDFTSPSRNFDAVLLAWESDFRLNLRDLFHSQAMDGPYQIASYSNPRADTLIDAAARAADRATATRYYRELQQILRNDQPWSFLYSYPDLVAVRDRLQNVDMDIRGAFVNVQNWWVTDPVVRSAAPAPGDSAVRAPSPAPAPAR